MIKKLRKKFVLINMAFVTLILLGVLIVVCQSNYQRYNEDSRMALRHALSEEDESLKPKVELSEPGRGRRPPNMGPLFVVGLDEYGEIVSVNDSGIRITEDSVKEAASAAQETDKDSGFLYGMQLRYQKQVQDDGMKIAFVDCSREMNGMVNLIVVSILIFVGAMAAFFGISLYLSKWALAPVEKAWIQQKQFIADASHELKTPLTVILANLGILSSHKEDTIVNQERWLANTKTEASRMKELLDNLLFLARSDTAEAPMVFAQFDLSNALWSCILPFESLAYEQDVELVEEITADIHMMGDEAQIKQLMAILLDNACKYVKKKGEIRIKLEKKQDKILLEVMNTGAVISEEELEHIFKRFYRADKSRVRKVGGYGLGLSIAQAIVEKHHGKIRAVSGEGEGTVFFIVLPNGDGG